MAKRKREASFRRSCKEQDHKAYFNDNTNGTKNYTQVELRRQAYNCTDVMSDYGLQRRRVQGRLLELFLPLVSNSSPAFTMVLDYLQEKDLGLIFK
jgi:hypothetical protein